ncbi:potassium-transporting ATPase subunit F [Streptomyces sp. CT34]|nr:potassium-transporting ATPase subunit F [Streptomyces sp. CT34]
MSVENIVGLVVAAGLVGHLVLCLVFPEKFQEAAG